MEGPFGVELPENLGSTSTESSSAPEGSQGTEISPDGRAPESAPQSLRTAAQPEAPKDNFLDLDKLERFRFDGREWSKKDFKNALLRQEDYSRKTMELSETRKYAENFTADLQAVIDNPALFAKFQGVYPKAYVEAAQRILDRIQGGGQPKQTDTKTTGQPDPYAQKIGEFEKKLSSIEQHFQQAEVEKNRAWLDNQYDTLSKKFPLADSEVVTARAEAALAQGIDLTDKVLEKLFKANHAEVQARFEKVYKERVNEQVKAGTKAKDTGAGGGTPGQAPRGLKTLKEAEAAMLADIASTRRR